jgi:hypothetical protein
MFMGLPTAKPQMQEGRSAVQAARPPSDAQLHYIAQLGGNPADVATMREASVLIDTLLKGGKK